MNKCLSVFLATIAIALAGCTSVQVCNEGANMITASNDGLFLFHAIPICSGDPEYPNQSVANWWSNTVNVQTNIKLLEERAAAEGAHGMKNLVTLRDSENVFLFFLKRKTCRTSAELIK